MGSRQARLSYGASPNALTAAFRASLNGILENYQAFADHIEEVTPEVLKEAMEPTLRKAEVYCPKDTGRLVDSSYLEVETRRGQHVVAIGFGKGGQPDYAVYVHEMPYEHAAPTRSKFLQAALDEDYATFTARVPQLLRAAAGT
jgi:hypothetical protein